MHRLTVKRADSISILLYGQKADRTHENKMLRAFIQAIKTDWADSNKDITLIANSMWDGHEVDLVCLLPAAVLIVDFKHYSGHLIGGENGPWRVNDEIVTWLEGGEVDPDLLGYMNLFFMSMAQRFPQDADD